MAWVFFEVAGIMVAFIAINACPAGRFFEWAARLNGILYLIANSMDAGPAAQSAMEEMEGDEALRRRCDGLGSG